MPIIADSVEAPHNQAELEKIFLAHHDRVYRAAYRITSNSEDAQDVVQSVFLRILRNHDDLSAISDIGNYLYRAGMNAAVDLVRSRKPTSEIDETTGSARRAWKPDRGHDSNQLRSWLTKAIAGLHPTAAEMFNLRYFEGFSNTEVAQILETSEGTVAVTLHRARTRLQKEMETVWGEQK